MTDNTIADRMADAAEENLGLPYSLVCDAWDDMFPMGSREGFENALTRALDAWEADRVGYQFNGRATDPALAEYDPADDEPDPEAERIAGIVRYFDEASTT